MTDEPAMGLVNAEGEVVRLLYRDGSHEDVEVLYCLLNDDNFGADLRVVGNGQRYNALIRTASLTKDLPVPLYRREALSQPIDAGTLPVPPADEPHRLVVGIELPPSSAKNGDRNVLYDRKRG